MSSELFSILGIVFGLIALGYATKLRKENMHLEILLNEKLSAKNPKIKRKETQMGEDSIEQSPTAGVMDERTKREFERAQTSIRNIHKTEGLKREYWDKLQSKGLISHEDEQLVKLQGEKAELEQKIKIAKSKFNDLDTETFNEITREYQKQLIAIEAKISGYMKNRKSG